MLAIYKKDNILYALAENGMDEDDATMLLTCLLYTSPSPRDRG